MDAGTVIPQERRERNPLITSEGWELLNRLTQHPSAPIWNYLVGDRINDEDLAAVERYREQVNEPREPSTKTPPEPILDWVRDLVPRSTFFAEAIPQGFDLERDWAHLPAMAREDLAARPEIITPRDADLSRLIVYDTSGTTGHALVVPHHPRDMGQSHALVEYALARHGLHPNFEPGMTACMNVCAQVHTVVFPMVFSVWRQAGFAKINFHPQDWRRTEHAKPFLDEFAPWFLTGDPVAYAEMIRWGVRARPRVIVSTAVELGESQASALREHFGCPVIDWYSTTETGPIACSCPQGHGLHVMPPDVFIEVLDEDGLPAPDGQPGEIAVTGGRNPYLPLLRYRTGDYAAIDRAPCPCGDPTPRLVGLQGRARVVFHTAGQNVVNPADVGRVLREFVFLQHEFIQRADGSCDLNLRPHPGISLDLAAIKAGLEQLFGPGVEIRVQLDPTLAERGRQGKVASFRSEP